MQHLVRVDRRGVQPDLAGGKVFDGGADITEYLEQDINVADGGEILDHTGPVQHHGCGQYCKGGVL